MFKFATMVNSGCLRKIKRFVPGNRLPPNYFNGLNSAISASFFGSQNGLITPPKEACRRRARLRWAQGVAWPKWGHWHLHG